MPSVSSQSSVGLSGQLVPQSAPAVSKMNRVPLSQEWGHRQKEILTWHDALVCQLLTGPPLLKPQL